MTQEYLTDQDIEDLMWLRESSYHRSQTIWDLLSKVIRIAKREQSKNPASAYYEGNTA